MKKLILLSLIVIGFNVTACSHVDENGRPTRYTLNQLIRTDSIPNLEKAAYHAELQTKHNTVYDGSWVKIGYPGGDPGYQQGVCTDVVIRALRCIDIDLQELIHEDMKLRLSDYNKRYRTKTIDKNIDHRRTQNIQTYLTGLGAKIPTNGKYKPGDILFWDQIGAGHTGIVSNIRIAGTNEYLVVHNTGAGPQAEDFAGSYPPTEAYRLTDDMIKKMQKDCTFEYDAHYDFKYYVK